MLRLFALLGISSRLCMKAPRLSKLISCSIRMFDDESLDEFYAKLNNIVNSAYNLSEIYDQPKIVRKIDP